jgi:hypothetical protein
MRVGMRLAEQMSDEQLDEFERFIDGDKEYARTYLNAHFPNWEQLPDYIAQVNTAVSKGMPADAVLPEFTALKWLETNFPNYKDVVANELQKLKDEIKLQSPMILQATAAELGQGQPTPPPPPSDDQNYQQAA